MQFCVGTERPAADEQCNKMTSDCPNSLLLWICTFNSFCRVSLERRLRDCYRFLLIACVTLAPSWVLINWINIVVNSLLDFERNWDAAEEQPGFFYLRWLFLGSTDHFHWSKLLEMICSFFGCLVSRISCWLPLEFTAPPSYRHYSPPPSLFPLSVSLPLSPNLYFYYGRPFLPMWWSKKILEVIIEQLISK